ncbi:hypothetical protein FGI21_12105 [Dickeya zeae]|uniref:Uncharacterized protein n=1 Tax=Dickeya zeae TaxID=204042 RepID=A0ABX8VXQ7_9GAMM|nr:hypothetical protein FGI21_12105 [Dickeya zeae]
MRDILSLTRGQPLAGQIRSRRICHSLAALQGSNVLCPKGPTHRVVQHASVLSCNSNYLGYRLRIYSQHRQ